MSTIRNKSASKIIYVTDLHLSQSTKGRLTDLCGRVQALPRSHKPDAIVLGGDTFGLNNSIWDKIVNNPHAHEHLSLAREEQERFVSSVFIGGTEKLMNNLPDLKIFYCAGNQDYYAQRYIEKNRFLFPRIECIDGKIVTFGQFSLIGMGGIRANKPWGCSVAEGPQEDNFGYFVKDQMDAKREKIKQLMEGATNIVFITHIPAYGHLDEEPGNENEKLHTGGKNLLGVVERYRPILHLTGHVHSQLDGFYSIINENTVSVNPGGGEFHDKGVKAVMIDVENLRLCREKNMPITPEVAEEFIVPF